MHRHRGVGILYLDSLDNVMGSYWYQNGRLGVKISIYRRYLKDIIYKYKKIGQNYWFLKYGQYVE